jgi:CDP-diglyceride synthetase
MTVASVGTSRPAARPSARRVVIGLVLAAVGLGLVAWPPGFALLVETIAIGALWELGKLAERKGVAIEFTVAALASTAFLLLT